MYIIRYEQIPEPVVALCRRLQRQGFEAYLVGGGVRDLLLGRQVTDWDVATSALPQQVKRMFRRTIDTGIRHGTVTVLLNQAVRVEVTTFRQEGAYGDGRHPDEVSFVPDLGRDLERRDFTINAIALDPVQRRLIDPLRGLSDLEAGTVRAVGDPALRFAEDGLRPLRAVRFSAVLQFELHEATLAAIAPAMPCFRRISAERVRDELLKLLASPRPSYGLQLMHDSGLLAEVLPELMAGIGLQQNDYHVDDVFSHSLKVCDAVEDRDPILRLAALLHDVGKPPTAQVRPDAPTQHTFYGHEQVGAEICAHVAQRLRLSTEQRERLCQLVQHHMIDASVTSGAGLRRFIRRVGVSTLADLFALRAADLANRRDPSMGLAALAAFRQRVDAEVRRQPILAVAQLAIDGQAVMERLGCAPGPVVGIALRVLLERVLDQPELNEHMRLLELLDEVVKTGQLDSERPHQS